MRYGMITSSMANIYTGVTVKIMDSENTEYFILDDGQFCGAIRKGSFVFISKNDFEFFAPRTEAILKFIADND